MSQTKTARHRKRQLGQFYTPAALAESVVADLPLSPVSTVLEPSAGNGAFVLPLIERFMSLRDGDTRTRLQHVLSENIFAVELDPAAHAELLCAVERRWGFLPDDHNLLLGDYFVTDFDGEPSPDALFAAPRQFDFIVGNPPFGGTIDPRIQDQLDGRYGVRDGLKIKKETYSLFIVRAVESLRLGGRLRFICSDTFLTIPTMKGLREFLLNRGRVSIRTITEFSDETAQPTVFLDFERSGHSEHLTIDGRVLARDTVSLTGNRSWQITDSLAPLFRGSKLGDIMVASSGMTIGRNDLFVREITDGTIVEPYEFQFREEPISLEHERRRARLGRLSDARMADIARLERSGATRRIVECTPLPVPRRIGLPHPDYGYYNKACGDVVYAPARWAVYWRDDGDAVKTFKKSGNWYLHGVGGLPYFKREGLTWQLIAPALNARYLPAGYILDSGAPCAFLRDGVDPDELWFVLGWCLTPLCTQVLKDVLNHTRNIQSKDFERLPYPFWVASGQKAEAIARVKGMVQTAIKNGRSYDRSANELRDLVGCYAFKHNSAIAEAASARSVGAV